MATFSCVAQKAASAVQVPLTLFLLCRTEVEKYNKEEDFILSYENRRFSATQIDLKYKLIIKDYVNSR